jgi:P-type Cu+ transporter
MLTGESMPVTKGVGDEVITATVNLSSMIWIKATRVGSDTTLSRIIELVQTAQSSKKAPIEALADKIAQIFVPVVISIAIIDFIIWISLGASGKIPNDWIPNNQSYSVFSLFFAISIMVIACPCAMGLASPTAIMVGTGLAARFGILIKGGGEAIEMAFRLDTIAFDKTGTLTYGKPEVVSAKNFYKELSNVSNEEKLRTVIWQIIETVESSSDHPLAKAVSRYTSDHLSNVTSNYVTLVNVTEIPGKGLQAIVKINDTTIGSDLLPNESKSSNSTYNVFIGNEKWLHENGCVYPTNNNKETTSIVEDWKNSGYSVVLVGLSSESSSGYIITQMGIADTPRPDAAKTVSELISRGIEVWMITGDNPVTAGAIAKKLGIENVLAEVTPEMKAEKIKWLQQKGRPIENSNKFLRLFKKDTNSQVTRRSIIAMIGDGINDSPALAQSDLPISIANATDVAIESASIILTRSTLTSLITLIELSKAIIWRIRYNFLWAYIYNSLAIPIAAGIFFPIFKYSLRPEIASLAMAASSVSVILSSLWLKRFKEPKY